MNTARKLGKLPHRSDPRTLCLTKYLDDAKLPTLPPSIDWAAKVPTFGMMLNDSIGDCTIAAAGHAVQCWTQNERGAEATIPDAEILAAYEAVSGYAPGDDASDTGCVELDVLRRFRGDGIGGHKIGAFALVSRVGHGTTADAAFVDHVRATIALTGLAYVGAAMPLAWQDSGNHWFVPAGGTRGDGAPGSWGGHAFILTGYAPAPAHNGGWYFTAISWGERITLSANALLAYVDEVWALLSPDWVDGSKPAPSGVDLVALQADLRAIGRVST